MKQKIAFLYLNTGAGHVAPAKAIANGLLSRYPDSTEPLLLNGFSNEMKISRFFFESGYQISTNYMESAYVLFYRMTEFPVSIRLGNYFVSLKGEKFLADFFRDQEITKVVCVHEVLILLARNALDRAGLTIPLITLVTDPFTAHALWFFEKRMELVVFSEKLRQEAIVKYGYLPSRVHTFNFMISKAFDHQYSPEEISAARARLGIPEDKKILLIAGGGEGLKNADRLVSHFILRKRPEILIVVCGKNKLMKRLVTDLVELTGAKNVKIFGFVSFMQDLLNIADCVITKGGASTVMEVLAVGKPVIFSTFIKGQELGNVLYVVHNGAGWYIRKSKDILDQAQKVIENPEFALEIKQNIAKLNIRNGLDDVVEFIHDFA